MDRTNSLSKNVDQTSLKQMTALNPTPPLKDYIRWYYIGVLLIDWLLIIVTSLFTSNPSKYFCWNMALSIPVTFIIMVTYWTVGRFCLWLRKKQIEADDIRF